LQSIPIHQAKTQLSELIRAVEQGEDVVLTRHGKPVARLVAERGDGPSPAERERLAAQALEELRAFRALWRPLEPGEQRLDWKALRDEGRKY
jgi:prevent-host-death family protein